MADHEEPRTIRIEIDQEAFLLADLDRHAGDAEAVFSGPNLARVLESVGPRFAPYVPLAVWEQIAGAAVSEVVFAVKQGQIGKPGGEGS